MQNLKRHIVIVFFFASLCNLNAQIIDVRSYQQIAQEFINAKHIDSAIPYLQDWTRIMPRDAHGKVSLAKCYIITNKPQLAADMLIKAVQSGVQETYPIIGDSLFEAFLEQYDSLLIASNPFFSTKGTAKESLIDAIHTSKQKLDFPLYFTEQKRMGRYRVLYPEGYSADKNYTLILLLHGNGLDPVFMLQWAKSLAMNDCIFIAPEAPYLKIKESFNSYQMKFTARAEDQRFPDSLNDDIIDLSAEWYHNVMLNAKSSLPFTAKAPIIMGFSQGGFFASVLLSKYPDFYSTAISLCGSMFEEGKINTRLDAVRKNNRDILIIHGNQDSIVPMSTAKEFDMLLTKAHISHTFIQFDGGHWPSNDVITDIKKWINNH